MKSSQKDIKVSIAMCTYNGAKYISEQLHSILSQSIKPFEIIISDDGSTDDTVALIQKIRDNTETVIKIYINEKRRGITANFANAIRYCTGNFIALSDQDDFWLPEKLEKQVRFLLENPNMDVVFSDLQIVDSQLNSLGRTMWQFLTFQENEQRDWLDGKAFNVLDLKGNKVTGCTLMITKAARDKYLLHYLDIAVPGKLHDEIIALLSARQNRIGFIKEALVLYRQHAEQVVGAKSNAKITRSLLDIASSFVTRETLVEQLEHSITEFRWKSKLDFRGEDIDNLEIKIEFLKERVNLSSCNILRIPTIVKNIPKRNYTLYTQNSIKNILKDLIFYR